MCISMPNGFNCVFKNYLLSESIVQLLVVFLVAEIFLSLDDHCLSCLILVFVDTTNLICKTGTSRTLTVWLQPIRFKNFCIGFRFNFPDSGLK